MEKETETEKKPCEIGHHRWHLVESLTETQTKEEIVIHTFVCDRCGFLKKVKREGLLPSSQSEEINEVNHGDRKARS